MCTSMCVVGFHGNNRYVLSSKEYQESALKIPEIARHLYEKYQANVIIYEKNRDQGPTNSHGKSD